MSAAVAPKSAEETRQADIAGEPGAEAVGASLQAADLPPAPLELQHAWYAVRQAKPWRSLGVVTATEGESSLRVALGLADMASRTPGQRVLVVNLHGESVGEELPAGEVWPECERSDAAGIPAPVALAEGRYAFVDLSAKGFSDQAISEVLLPALLHSDTPRWDAVLVALGSPAVSAVSVPVARALDGNVLCVFLGLSHILHSKQVVQLVGESHWLGSLTVRAAGDGGGKKSKKAKTSKKGK